jgi:hypothetical protein
VSKSRKKDQQGFFPLSSKMDNLAERRWEYFLSRIEGRLILSHFEHRNLHQCKLSKRIKKRKKTMEQRILGLIGVVVTVHNDFE